MPATGHDDHEVVGAGGDRPRIQGEALTRHLARVDLDPRWASRAPELFCRDPRMLPEELTDRCLGPAEAAPGLGHHARNHQDARRTSLVAGETGHVGHAHEVGHAVHALERVFLGRLLLGAAPPDVGDAVGEGERDRAGARREAVTLGGVRRPARRESGRGVWRNCTCRSAWTTAVILWTAFTVPS